MMSRGFLTFLMLPLLIAGCSHGPRWLAADKSTSMVAPVTASIADISDDQYWEVRQQWDKVFSALAGSSLATQKKLLHDIANNTTSPIAEINLQKALLLALGDSDISDLSMAFNLTSKYQTRPEALSPQARFSILIIKNKQADTLQMDALNSKLEALKSIEESMMRRGQE